MPRLYANENFPLPVVLALRRLGHDVLTMLDTDRADKRTTDAEVLQFARSEDRAVLTLTENISSVCIISNPIMPGSLSARSTLSLLNKHFVFMPPSRRLRMCVAN